MSGLLNSARPRFSHIWPRARHAHYCEEPWVSTALFRAELFVGSIWDPACGFGHIVDSAKEAGYDAFGTDIVNRTKASMATMDFLATSAEVDNIVTNPPFHLIQEFAERAVVLARRKAALIFPVRRLNAAGAWLGKLPLARICFISPRPSMPPGPVYRQYEKAGKRPSRGSQDFAWLVFERGHSGAPESRWLTRDGRRPVSDMIDHTSDARHAFTVPRL
jgi:hypothetical protein